MQVFKCAVSLVFRNPVLLLVYAVGLGLMGVLMGSSFAFDDAEGIYTRPEIDYAVIDRDNSQISSGIAEFLTSRGTEVPVEDSRQALQDCVAKGDASFVLIIPEGFESAFLEAAESGAEPPTMETVYSFYSSEGFIMDAALANYLGALKTYLIADAGRSSDADIPAATAQALGAVEETVDVQMVSRDTSAAGGDRFCFYLQFDSYTFFAAIISCLGMLLSNMNRTDMRKRALSSPVSYASYTLQIALACLLVTALVWVWLLLLGFIAFGDSAAAISPVGLALMAAVAFAFALVALAIAFLVGQTGINGTGANAIGNILGLVVSFLGGAWIPLDLASAEVNTVAHFLPGFWYTDGLAQAAHLTSGALDSVASIGGNIGILLLFAAAIFCAGLVVGKLRVQTSQAGGNAAAALPSMV